jgi:hypothetical protein
VAHRYRYDNHLAEARRVRDRRCLPSFAELLDKTRERLRATGVADRDLVPSVDKELGERSADMPGADDPDPQFTTSPVVFECTEPTRVTFGLVDVLNGL